MMKTPIETPADNGLLLAMRGWSRGCAALARREFARSLGRKRLAPADLAAFSSACAGARAGLSVVTCVAALVLAARPATARAGDLLRAAAANGTTAGVAGAQASAAQAAAQQQQLAQVQRARDSLTRATQVIQAMQAAQAAARTAAMQAAASVPNGLVTGGLVVATGATPGSSLWQNANAPTSSVSGGVTTVEIDQTAAQAILTWSQFNLGQNTRLYFNQTAGGSNASQWIALNRVTDPSTDPSRILGSITAEGQVYIVNPNGIIFGGSSQVNVQTLMASALDFNGSTVAAANARFQQGIAFDDNDTAASYQTNYTLGVAPGSTAPVGNVTVKSGARIVTADNGTIFLFGKNVTNAGSLSAPDGQVLMAAGSQIWVTKNWLGYSGPTDTGASDHTDPYLRGVRAVVQNGGTAENDGLIESDRGNIMLSAGNVTNTGVLLATTSPTADGSVTLLAGDGAANDTAGSGMIAAGYWMWATTFGSLTLAPGSLIAINPDNSQGTALPSQFIPSRIQLFGRQVAIQSNATIYAPAAKVQISGTTDSTTATAANDSSGIAIDSGALISLAGLVNVPLPMSYNDITGQLNLAQLANDPAQRTGALHGQSITVDLRRGTTFADMSGYYALVQQSASQAMTGGGSLQLDGGKITTAAGSVIDLSGGSVQFLAGNITTTLLRGTDERVYDVTTANPNFTYSGIYGAYTQFQSGYVQGAAAGSLTIGPVAQIQVPGAVVKVNQQADTTASGVRPYATSFAGEVDAGVIAGPYQRNAATGIPTPRTAWQQIPQSASLTVGYTSLTGYPTGPDVTLGDVPATSGITLPSRWFDGNTFGNVALVSGVGGGNLTIESGVNVNLGAFGSFGFTGSHALIDGSISAPGGSVTLTADWAQGADPNASTPALIDWNSLTADRRPWIRMGAGASINVAGFWVNDLLAPTETTALAINGGTVTMKTVGDLSLPAGAVIDVSGGGRLTAGNTLVSGNGGAIDLGDNLLPTGGADGFIVKTPPTSAVGNFDVFDATLRGYALGTGGSLTLGIAQAVTITAGSASDGSPVLSPGFFQQNGFASYSVTSGGDLTVAPGTTVTPYAMQYVANPGLAGLATGGALQNILTTGIIDPQAGYLPVNPANFTGSGGYAGWLANLLGGRSGYSPGDLRQPVSLTLGTALKTDSNAMVTPVRPLNLTLGAGASLTLDPLSKVTLSASGPITVNGVISAPGGAITLAVANTNGDTTITLGPDARLLVPGYVKVTPGSVNLSAVMAAGSVTLSGGANATVMTDPASVIDISGVSGTSTLLGASSGLLGQRSSYVSQTVPGDAGSVTFTDFVGGLISGSVKAFPGGVGASGGAVVISAGDFANALTTGLSVGDNASITASTGTLAVYAPAVFGNGADSLTLASLSQVAFDGAVTISAGRSLTLETPLIGIAAGAPANSTVTLASPYASFSYFPGVGGGGNSAAADPATQASKPVTLTGTLNVNAGLIDFAQILDLGGNGLGGFARANFNSTGDIRLTPGGISSARLQSAGALTLTSAQTYVTSTDSAAVVRAYSIRSATSVTFQGDGASASVPYSFGGTLNVTAPDIIQAGVLRAPLGAINLNATNTLTLAPGSLTSVSLDGLTAPYGAVSTGVFSGDASQLSVSGAVPVKTITLAGKTVTVAKGATVDVAGSGDLYAYEFVPGNGGSSDILSQPGMFAVLPGYTLGAAPVVPATAGVSAATGNPFSNTSGLTAATLQAGDSVYLSGIAGLPAGVYTLLPAHYALLPGGVAIKALSSGYSGTAAAVTQPDGSQVVSGHTLVQGTGISSAVTTRFLAMSGVVLRSYSQFEEYGFNTAVSALATGANLIPPQLPQDAGTLVLNASQSLTLDGRGLFDATNGGLLGNVDISALKIALVGAGKTAPDASYLTLDTTQFTNFGIGSLLLGGTRTATATGTQVNVTATDIVVANDAASALTLPELILAATGTITADAGSVLRASGSGAGDTAPLLLSGDGALVRLSTGAAVTVTRTGATGAAGDLAIGTNVTFAASGSLLLSGTRTVTTGAGLSLTSPQVALSSSGISLGGAPPGVSGLVLDSAALASLASTNSLTLTAAGTIDLYGAVAVGGAALNNLTLDAAGLDGFGASGDIATLTAGTITLQNSTGASGGATATGSGSLALNTSTLTPGSGAFAVNGVSGVVVTAAKTDATGTGSLTVSAPLTLNTDMLTAGKGSDYRIISTGSVSIAQANGTTQTPDAFGGRLSVTGTGVALNTTVSLPAGIVALTATTGDLTLGGNAKILSQGVSTAFYDVTRSAAGGSVTLTATGGSVTAAAGSVIDVSGSTAGAAGGSVSIAATQGATTFSGALLGAGSSGSPGGSFALDAGTTANFTALNDALNSGGFDATRSVRLRNVGLTLSAGDTIAAHDVTLRSDTGAITVDGAIGATGSAANPNGGTITLEGGAGVTVGSGAVLDTSTTYATTATGYATTSGTVAITADAGSVSIASGSVINASGGGRANGAVIITARRSGNDVLVAPLAGTITAPSVIVRGDQTYDESATGTVNAGDVTTMLSDAATWMANAGTIAARLGTGVVVQPGIVVTASGDLTIGADGNAIDLHTARYGANAVPGAITFTAGGDLNIDSNVSDGFSSAATSGALLSGSSWSPTFNAGNDITLAAGTLVRTGTGSVVVNAGRDLNLTDTTSVIYTAGGKVANASGFTAGSRVGDYPVNGGDIAITAGRDINAPVAADFVSGWLYRYGYADTTAGNSTAQMTVGSPTSWSVVFANFDQGVGALGGGNVAIAAGGDIRDLSVALPTTGQQTTAAGAPVTSGSIVVRGGGNLALSAGGGIYGGVYMLGRGAATLTAGDAITSDVQTSQRINPVVAPTASISDASVFVDRDLHALFALSDATLSLTARGDVQVEAVVDPMMIPEVNANLTNKLDTFFTSYTNRTAVSLTSVSGDVTYHDNPWAGADLTVGTKNAVNQLMSAAFGAGGDDIANTLLYVPGTFSATALQGDVAFDQYFATSGVSPAFRLAPTPDGNLTVLSGGSFSAELPVILMDESPDYVRTALAPFRNRSSNNLLVPASDSLGAATNYGRGSTPTHAGDTTPVRIYTLTGSIAGSGLQDFAKLTVSTPKPAVIRSGLDIQNFALLAENNTAADVTVVSAARDITNVNLQVYGPGQLEVLAGRNLSLVATAGTSQIVSTGNVMTTLGTFDGPSDTSAPITVTNLALANSGASLDVLAGASGADLTAFANAYFSPTNASGVAQTYVPQLTTFMSGLGYSGDPATLLTDFNALSADIRRPFLLTILFDELRRTGIDATGPNHTGYTRGYDAIARLFPAGTTASGNIDLFGKPVKTQSGGDIAVAAPHGSITVDVNTNAQSSGSGVVTQNGGAISMFSKGDIGLGNSRVFTLQGGDVLMWTSQGSITAGNGSNTSASAPVLKYTVDNFANVLLNAQGLSTGSGIGVLDAGSGAVKSRLDLIAPVGTVDAGDAGIRSAGALNIAALVVLGANNISASGPVSGVPVAAVPNVSAAVAASTTSAASSSGASEEMKRQQTAANRQEPASVFTVEVLGYGGGNGDDDGKKKSRVSDATPHDAAKASAS